MGYILANTQLHHMAKEVPLRMKLLELTGSDVKMHPIVCNQCEHQFTYCK